jgi:hypothetical protein
MAGSGVGPDVAEVSATTPMIWDVLRQLTPDSLRSTLLSPAGLVGSSAATARYSPQPAEHSQPAADADQSCCLRPSLKYLQRRNGLADLMNSHS